MRDPRPLVCEALAALIRQMSGCVLAEFPPEPAGNAEPGVDVLLVGVPSPPARALDLVCALKIALPGLPIVLLADALDQHLLSFVLDHRLSGLLLTDSSSADLAASLGQVVRGNVLLPAGWQQVYGIPARDPLQALSERQMEVLELLAEGLAYEEIAAKLFISANTVKFHVRGIFLRLGVRNRTAAARYLAKARLGVGARRTTLA